MDGCLIDVKATKDPHNLDSSPWARQLLGYALFDSQDALAVRSFAVYLARQGVLVEWPIDRFYELLGGEPKSLPELRWDFKRAVRSKAG